MHKNFKDLTGQKFGRLKVIKLNGKDKNNIYNWFCRCDCGNYKIIIGSNLRNNQSRSCGCLRNEFTSKINLKHNRSRTVEYKSWRSMKDRCLNKNNPMFKYYGGRGITICGEWLDSFETFYKDVGKRNSKNHSIDRIDNSKDYCKENCRWATKREQVINRRNTIFITYKNKTFCLSEWSKKLKIKYDILYSRLFKGWSIERAFTKK